MADHDDLIEASAFAHALFKDDDAPEPLTREKLDLFLKTMKEGGSIPGSLPTRMPRIPPVPIKVGLPPMPRSFSKAMRFGTPTPRALSKAMKFGKAYEVTIRPADPFAKAFQKFVDSGDEE